MADVPRKRYRRTDLEKESESSGSDPEEELYVPLKERRKLQFTEIEKAAGIKNRFDFFLICRILKLFSPIRFDEQ